MAFPPGGYWANMAPSTQLPPEEQPLPTPFNVVFALYPHITQLDFTGPYEVLTRLPGAKCVLASVEGGDLEVDAVMRFTGLRRLDSIDACDLLCVPGGFGTVAAVEDQAYLAALRRLGAKARFITSVCTGSLLLAPSVMSNSSLM